MHDEPVTALSISSQGEAIVPVSADGEVLAPSPVSSDSRAASQANALIERIGFDRIYELTGQPVSSLFSLPKIMWWKDHAPELHEHAWKFLCYGDFVTLRLGLEPIIDRTMAARTLAYDIRSNRWSEEILDAAGIDAARFASVLPSGTVIGEIPGQIAGDLGFAGSVQVVAGGHDQPCAALGAGVIEPGAVMYSIGTTEAIVAVLTQARPELRAGNFAVYPHVVPLTYVALAGNQTGGRLLRWYRDVLGTHETEVAKQENVDVYEVIMRQVTDRPSGLLILPYFAGSGTLENDATATGAIVGLTFDTRREDLVKAILEGVTYEQALCLRYLRERDVPIHWLNAVGGGARSPVWLQIKADIVGLPINRIRVSEAASLGAALLAGWGSGVYASLADGVERVVSVEATFPPRQEQTTHYRDRLDLYAQLYLQLRPVFAEL
jgi:xylulokinase